MVEARHPQLPQDVAEALREGVAFPAHPLALNADRKLDERRQRALTRYYMAAGAGGLAVGVHTTQFQIRDPKIGLFRPVLELAAEEMDRAEADRNRPFVRVAGICGQTAQAVEEAALLREVGYHAGLLNLGFLPDANEDELMAHCHAVSAVIPLFGFYLQPVAGGRLLPQRFWRRLAEEIPNLVAVKISPFNRYQTNDVVRGLVEAGRDDVALYTGNDDNIVMDLLTPFTFLRNGERVERRIVGGLLGHWAAWTQRAAQLVEMCHRVTASSESVPADMLRLAVEVTDANAALFDVANGFGGATAGIHEVLRRQGLLEGIWCLDPAETLGPGQMEEIDRVYAAYPHLNDDAFVREHLEAWLAG